MFGALTNQLTIYTVGPTVSLYSLSCHIYHLSLLALSLLSPQKNIIFSQNFLKISFEGFQILYNILLLKKLLKKSFIIYGANFFYIILLFICS